MADAPPPPPERMAPPRLPGSYTVGHERDASPSVGRVVLVVLALLCLGLQGAEFLFLPHANLARLLGAAVRIGTIWVCFLAVAAGLGFARWPLAVFHVGLGLWLMAHAMMGTFAAAYPHVSGGSSLVPGLLGALFLGSGGWFGLSADLTAYLDRQRSGAMTVNSRLATAGLLALALGVPAFGLSLTATLRANRGGFRQTETARRMAPVPVPPQSREGAEFVRDLVERAVRAQDYAVITAAMSPEIRAQVTPEQTRQVSASFARHGPPLGMELTDVFFNLTYDQRRELTYCNVFAVCTDRKVCFHCYVSREVGTPGWQVDMVTIE